MLFIEDVQEMTGLTTGLAELKWYYGVDFDIEVYSPRQIEIIFIKDKSSVIVTEDVYRYTVCFYDGDYESEKVSAYSVDGCKKAIDIIGELVLGGAYND